MMPNTIIYTSHVISTKSGTSQAKWSHKTETVIQINWKLQNQSTWNFDKCQHQQNVSYKM